MKVLPQIKTEIIKRSDTAKGFEVLPRRWVVERSFAWFNRCRRLAKDWENLSRNALAFLASLPSDSCSEGSAILHKPSGRTLRADYPPAHWAGNGKGASRGGRGDYPPQ